MASICCIICYDRPFSFGWVYIFLGEVWPCWRHHRHTFLAEIKVMSFLIILDISSGKYGCPILRVITELTLCCTLEISGVCAKCIMRTYLIKRILVAHKFILCEIERIFFLCEFLALFRLEILTPTSWVVPVRSLKVILHLFIYDNLSVSLSFHELVPVDGIIPRVHSTKFIISLSHFFFLIC